MSHVLNKRRVEELERTCREHGLPVTVQRRIVFEAIIDHEDHPTADQIYDQIKTRVPDISRTTVYRVLDTLVRLGLITKICHPGSAARFDPKIRQHYHLVCLSCERIIDVEEPRLNRVPVPDVRGHGFQINDYHVHFRGTCADCLRKQKTKPRASRSVGRPKAGQKKMSLKNPKDKKRRSP